MDHNIEKLNGWLAEKEGEHLEFKQWSAKDDFEALCKYCCAIANEGGGKVILGVTDKRPRKVHGTFGFSQPERTRKGLCDRLQLRVDFEEIHHPDCQHGSRVLVFHVPPRPFGVPLKSDGRYWMRQEDSLVEMTEDRLRSIFAETGYDFSSDECPGLKLTDLDQNAIAEFKARWIAKASKTGDSSLAERLNALKTDQLLSDAEALVDGKLNYAALILFGSDKSLSRHLPQSELVFEYRSSNESGPAQERREFREGFFGYFESLWSLINKRNDKQEFQEGLFVFQISTFSDRTVREALLNAVCHRNYQLGGSVFVRQFPRRLEIDSPGGLPFGITLENILDRQNPRNRRIAEILTKCGLVERSGQGMNLIFEELIKESKPIPDFSRTDQYQVGLTLHGTVENPDFIRFVEKVGKETSEFFDTHDWMIFAAAARGEKPRSLSDRRIRRLFDLGIIELGRGRTLMLSRRFYQFVGKRGTYTRRKGLSRSQNRALLLNHIEENKANGCKLKDLCEVLNAIPPSNVQSLLRSMKRQGQVYSVGNTNQGRWYPGPGPEHNAKAQK